VRLVLFALLDRARCGRDRRRSRKR
jgi:hypothetical protein